MVATAKVRIPIERVEVSAYRVPTDRPESDGTLAWDHTGLVVVEVRAGGARGLGWTYTHPCAARLIEEVLAEVVRGRSAMEVRAAWDQMRAALRNVGTRSLGAAAISAVDVALWDLKARLLDLPLVTLFGQVRARVPVYGSGGFTSDDVEELQRQLAGWTERGCTMVKMKVGREPDRDPVRVRAARDAIGAAPRLFVDANGAYDRKQALAMMERFAAHGVSWMEEPVSSDDLDGLRFLRERGPAGMYVTAGEYGWDVFHFRDLLEGGAVDVLQADATRCQGYTGFAIVAALCEAHCIPLSAHTAPALHHHLCCALTPVVHLEYFHDHARIDALLFEGAPELRGGALEPALERPGHGVSFDRTGAAAFAV